MAARCGVRRRRWVVAQSVSGQSSDEGISCQRFVELPCASASDGVELALGLPGSRVGGRQGRQLGSAVGEVGRQRHVLLGEVAPVSFPRFSLLSGAI